MSKHHDKQVLLVRSLLDKPKWYNETITHPNWPIIKRAMSKYLPISVVDMPPTLLDNYPELSDLRRWRQDIYSYAILPPKNNLLIGVTA